MNVNIFNSFNNRRLLKVVCFYKKLLIDINKDSSKSTFIRNYKLESLIGVKNS